MTENDERPLTASLRNTRSHAVSIHDFRDGVFKECLDAEAVRAALRAEATRDEDEADGPALDLSDQPLVSVAEDGDHEHTGVPCRTCVVMGASVDVDAIEAALPYGDFDREPGESFIAWRRRFAEHLHSRLARPGLASSPEPVPSKESDRER